MKRFALVLWINVVLLGSVDLVPQALAAGTASCAATDCADPAGDCHCDDACVAYGDCCADYAEVCSAALRPALMAASPADIFVTRSTDVVSGHIIPGFFTHTGLKDFVGDNWFHSLGHVDGGWFDCPLGLFGGVKYEAAPGDDSDLLASAVFHVTNVSNDQRIAAADFAYSHFLAHYPFQTTRGLAWSGDAEQSGAGTPTYCSSRSSSQRSNYDWAWIDTRPNDRPYCSALVFWSYQNAVVDACGTLLGGAGFEKPLYDHSGDFGPNCLWLGRRYDGIDGDVCDAVGGMEGFDAAGHFLGWVQGVNEPSESAVQQTCETGVEDLWAITPTELVEEHVDSGYTEGYFAFSYAYEP